MKQKAFVLQNKGMNRDLSISKTGESSAYENHNIRILARDHDTLLSVTNERGNKVAVIHGLDAANLRVTENEEVRITENELYRVVSDDSISGDVDFRGILIGWNVLNNNVILFTNEGTTDRIYHVWYEGGKFYGRLLFQGFLNFSINFPIESVVYHETDDIQKIYWVDGRNVLRFMNFMAKADDTTHLLPWQVDEYEYDNTYFDSNRAAEFGVKVNISKDNSGNTRANGVIQYLLTYYNKHGQETGYVWISDLVYLSPFNRGGSADDTNSNRVMLSISNLDTRFDHFRIYSVFRSALNGTVVSYLVGDGAVPDDESEVYVVDDGSHQTAQDAASLLYLGSQPVHAWTLAHKDQTLFLGDLQSVGHDFTAIEKAIKESGMYDKYGISNCIEFEYSRNNLEGRKNIPYVKDEGTYSYENQLRYTSSEITTFKGGEKYRFALKFQLSDGFESPAFWIGDAENKLYPHIDNASDSIQRAIAYCTLPDDVVRAIKDSDLNIKTVQLCIAEATYADRSVKAQGILNPTMFNMWDRYNNRTFAMSSWISRPRNARYANRHFQPVNSASDSNGEIECNWWDDDKPTPTPYYRYINYPGQTQYEVEYGGETDYDYLFVVYGLSIDKHSAPLRYDLYACVYKATLNSPNAAGALGNYSFTSSIPWGTAQTKVHDDQETFTIIGYRTPTYSHVGGWGSSIERIYTRLAEYMQENYSLSAAYDEVVSLDTVYNWFSTINNGLGVLSKKELFFTPTGSASGYSDIMNCLNSSQLSRWMEGNPSTVGKTGSEVPSRYTKHIMFVDENIVTLNSPEFEYEAVDVDENDGLKLRIIGVARVTSGNSDYTVDASPGKKPGSNLIDDKFNWTLSFGNKDGLLSWPMWEERNLDPKQNDEDEGYVFPEDPKKRTSTDYNWGSASVYYWLHMWNHVGLINYFDDPNDNGYGLLHSKTFANLKYSYDTLYRPLDDSKCTYNLESLRQYNYLSSQYVYVSVNGGNRYYNGNIQTSLLPPNRMKYPILYSTGRQPTDDMTSSSYAFLYSSEPVQLEFLSSPHAVMSLGSGISGNRYSQTILPYVDSDDKVSDSIPSGSGTTTDALVPWIDQDNGLIGYNVNEELLTVPGFDGEGMYFLVGELYQEYDASHPDERYGGITEADIANCRFMSAGPQFLVDEMRVGYPNKIYANQGDTFFQRWDCMKTKPYSTGAVNNVIDITSFMVETHINIDGRTDLLRGIDDLASIESEKFGTINPVYSQKNNYKVQRDLDDDANTDSYRSTITWSLEKRDSEEVDEWSHVTLASTLKLDGDKGFCRALRRLGNSVIAFQDRGISEVLFNSRTQLTTTDGVPVEIANSGKVDGKRYITNKYGCTNKWSIVEGKAALYFVDNINKAFCAFNGQAIDNLSAKLGFGVWFREVNNTDPWRPVDFNNIVSYYDKVHSDIYLVRNTDDKMPCLVYNENLGAFTSFFDYSAVLMMTNVEDRFLSFKNHRVWLQNEGLYGNFFGSQYGFWTQYRVTPDPYLDKIWTNVEYRADVYEVLDENGDSVVPEEYLINGDMYNGLDDTYKENESFTDYEIWNEYQETGVVPLDYKSSCVDPARKKFRIWRLTIPRALHKVTGKPSLDRIRNPWINVKFRKSNLDGRNLMQMHDFIIKYFE